MFWLWLALGVSLVFAVLTILDMILWIARTVQAFRRLHEQRLWRENTTALGASGASTPMLSVLTLMPYSFVHLWINPQQEAQDPWLHGLMVFALCIWGLVFVLWGCTLYLRRRAQPKPRYYYFLPQDARRVRRDQCVFGMYFATGLLPRHLKDPDILDTLARSGAVATRVEVFSAGRIRDGYRFTNDFKVCCDLFAEGFKAGYQGMVALYQYDEARYEEVASLVEQYMESNHQDQVEAAVYEVVKELLGPSDDEQPDSLDKPA